jgi:hypothetical protein
MTSVRRDGWTWLLLALGVGSVANALWMLVDPARWYHDLPAGVPDTGPLNVHFVRDIGCAFLTAGLALLAAVRWPHWRLPLVATAAFFFVAHAALHVHDTARGIVDAHHWWLDAPGVYLPAIALAWASVVFVREERAR